jgi:gamma-butyrobetaine dioxygenase
MRDGDVIEIEGRRFPGIWLRDNCLCPLCRHPTSFQKLFDFSALPAPPRALALQIADGAAVITWDGEPPHVSRFPIDWLAAQGDDSLMHESPGARATYWSAAEIRDAAPRKHELAGCDPEGGPWLDDLLGYGFALFTGMTLDRLDRFMSAIGPIHHTEYGRFADVRSTPGANDLAETGYALTVHTDYSTYMHVAPLLQFMYFEAHDSMGGESLLVDGVRAAQDFGRAEPRFFELLATVPVEFHQRYAAWRYHHCRTRTVIELGPTGQVAGVFFGHSHAGPWRIPFERAPEYYEAYAAFFALLKSPEYVYAFRLGRGEGMAVQNARVLHGRNAFDTSTGIRHLVTGYVPWEYLEARLRFARTAPLYAPAPT